MPYDLGPMHRAALLAALLAAPSVSVAAPKAGGKGACGATILPLNEGNTWSYQWVPPADPPDPSLVRLTPPAPKTVTITVKKIEQQGKDTVVSLEEKIMYSYQSKDPAKPTLEDRTVATTITCNATKFDISPGSFFFAGEPGGFLGIKLDKVERKGTSWKLAKGTYGESEWPEDLVISWTRTPHEGSMGKPATGKLELERRYTPAEAETINTKTGQYKAEKLGLTTTGRVTLDVAVSADLKPMELPAGWTNVFWFVPGTGVIQVLNRFAHQYQLVDSQLK